MNSEITRPPGRWDRDYDAAAVVILAIASAVLLWTWRDFGITWDEGFHVAYGDHIYAFFESEFEDKSALSYRIDYLYGGGFDLAGAIFRKLAAPLDEWDGIHLFGTLIGILGLWGTWKLARVLGGPRAGLLGAAFICATSVYWGHIPNNPKDLPFAVGHVWAMAYLVEAIRAFPKLSRTLQVKLAVAMGLAMSVRIAGLLLLCYFAAAIVAWVVYQGWQRRDLEAMYQHARRLGLTGLAVAAGAWLVMIVWWPWAMYDPIKRPLAALRRMSQFMTHERQMPFAGEMISTFDVDWRYMPHYFGLKLPEFVVVLAVVGVVVGLVILAIRARDPEHFTDNLVLGTVLFALLFPWVYAVIKQSVLYDGLRHFLFLVPLVVAGVAWFAEAILAIAIRRLGAWSGIILGFVFAALCMDQYATMARLHPYQYVYFNRFIGGVEGAVGNYDTDYYAATYGEAGELLARSLWQTEPDEFLETNYSVSGCGGEIRTLRRTPPNFMYRNKGGDFHVGYTRKDCHLRYQDSPIVVELTREGALLTVARDLRNRAKPPARVEPTPTRKPKPEPSAIEPMKPKPVELETTQPASRDSGERDAAGGTP
jgi:hypothetical protein